MGRVILWVLDGFGIGAMKDCEQTRPEDINANTLQHIRDDGRLKIPTLNQLGLEAIIHGTCKPLAAFGRANLAHFGADTFMGHQELMGSRPKKPAVQLMKQLHELLKNKLEARGYEVTYPKEGTPLLLVNQAVVIGDNLESQYGNIINVIGDLNQMPFAEVCAIGKVVRENVVTSRVIIFGNQQTNIATILQAVRNRRIDQWGVDAPLSKVYGPGYHVLHLGYGAEVEQQFAYMANEAGFPVYRIGKTADVIQVGGFCDAVVDTKELCEVFDQQFQASESNAIFLVNVQETDLAGHSEKTAWYRDVLETVDLYFQQLIPKLASDDLLIITADHGNDPAIGHSNHTREQTPILVYGAKVKPVSLGERQTMADIAATMAEWIGIGAPESGTSFYADIVVDR